MNMSAVYLSLSSPENMEFTWHEDFHNDLAEWDMKGFLRESGEKSLSAF